MNMKNSTIKMIGNKFIIVNNETKEEQIINLRIEHINYEELKQVMNEKIRKNKIIYTYQEAIKILKDYKLDNMDDYNQLCEKDPKLSLEPEEDYNKFDLIEYFSINIDKFYTKDKIIEILNSYNIYKIIDKCDFINKFSSRSAFS